VVPLYGFDDSAASTCLASNGTVFVNGLSPAQQTSYVADWQGDAVRISLNEDCWLGINGAPVAFDAAAYQSGIKTAVSALNAMGDYVILDLHWSAPGSRLAKGQQLMADDDHSPALWASVAATFANDAGVLFELYNEPHNISWSCWLSGCVVPAGWLSAGMQSLVQAVRSAGSHQVLLLGGLGYANDLSGWLQNVPHDPLGQLAAAFHLHNVDNCVDPSCWNQSVAPVAQAVPVVATELGERDSGSSLVTQFASWADARAISYLGWQASRPYAATLRQIFRQHLAAS
jgi:hypothetical protein